MAVQKGEATIVIIKIKVLLAEVVKMVVEVRVVVRGHHRPLVLVDFLIFQACF